MNKLFIILLLLSACTITGDATIEIIEENTQEQPRAYFCEKENCEQKLQELLNNASKIRCAFYSLKSEKLTETLNQKKAQVIIEADNKKNFNKINTKNDNRAGLMHNKFCTLDDSKIITGSWNPAMQTNTANNLIVVTSKFIAQNYKDEFEEMSEREFGRGKKTNHPLVLLNGNLVENYFCPEDNCQKQVLRTLNNAKKSIYFMTYSFTDNKIGDEILKKNTQGITTKGIFDKSQITEWSQYEKLKQFSTAKKGIHHKVFIIDEETVITGSYNPTTNGNKNNDENIIIMHNKEIAQKFLDEFNSLLA